MRNFEVLEPEVVIAWGCNPQYQYERDWLLNLLRPCWVKEVNWYGDNEFETFKMHPKALVILVESSRYLLSAKTKEIEVKQSIDARNKRIRELKHIANLIILHVSDEEGFDGDILYPHLQNN